MEYGFTKHFMDTSQNEDAPVFELEDAKRDHPDVSRYSKCVFEPLAVGWMVKDA